MLLAEPMTMATDYVLALLGLWLGRQLWTLGEVGDPRRGWAAALWAMALAAFLGGSSHGFAPMLSEAAQAVIWRATLVVLGGAAVLLVHATLRTLRGGVGWTWFLGVEFLCYSAWICFLDSDFRYAVIQYGTALLVVLIGHLVLASRRWPGALTVVGGIAISFVAAWIQQAGISLHPHFNHNDLYHVVQMVGLFVLYRGAAATGATWCDQRT